MQESGKALEKSRTALALLQEFVARPQAAQRRAEPKVRHTNIDLPDLDGLRDMPALDRVLAAWRMAGTLKIRRRSPARCGERRVRRARTMGTQRGLE